MPFVARADVSLLEADFGIRFPPWFREYLLAAFQLCDQVGSVKYDQLIMNPDVPSNDRLGPTREMIESWRPLIDSNYVPFAQWGDGWGPMCFDTAQRREDDDCPIVWMDHALVIPLGTDKLRQRAAVEPCVNTLYASYREYFFDVFGTPWERGA